MSLVEGEQQLYRPNSQTYMVRCHPYATSNYLICFKYNSPLGTCTDTVGLHIQAKEVPFAIVHSLHLEIG